jgi:tetratricopeptide (TPR) repeat protein
MRDILGKLKDKLKRLRIKVTKWWQRCPDWARWALMVVGMIAIAAVLAMFILAVFPRHKAVSKILNNPAAQQYQQKLDALKKDAAKKPRDAISQREYGVALYATGQLDDAKTQYNKAISVSPKDATLYNNLGNVERDLTDYKGAASAYNKAISLNAQLLNAYVNLANMQIYNQHDVDAGIATYQTALKGLPGNNEIRLLLGLAYEQKGDKASALQQYQTILQSDPNNAAAAANLKRLQS